MPRARPAEVEVAALARERQVELVLFHFTNERLFANPVGVMRAATARLGETPSTRDLILDVAERCFAERGFAGVSMRAIAAGAGLKNQASLYHHFRDKQALYEAVLARGLSPVLALVAESGRAWATGRSDATVDRFLDRVVDHLAEHASLPRLLQRAALDDSPYLRSVLRRHLRPIYTQGLTVLAAAGPWTPEELPHLAAGLYHLIFGYFADTGLLETVSDDDPRSPTAVARQRRFLRTAVARILGVVPPRRLSRRR
jgi:AcrR family transcriptional regulator